MDLDLQTRKFARYPLHYMTYAPESLKLFCPTVKREMHLQEIFDLTLTQSQGHIKHCPLRHVTYVPAKFEVATANG